MYGKSNLIFFAPLLVTLVVAILALNVSWACSSGGVGRTNKKNPKGPAKENELTKDEHKKQLLDQSGLGGFAVPEHMKIKWKQWLKKYNLEQKLGIVDLNVSDPTLNDPDVPNAFKGYGIGNQGFPPLEIPPWGYKPKNLGLPSFCYTPPDKGFCTNPNTSAVKRWSFNPFIEDCQEFEYSGCLGNYNNFVKKLNCINACTKLEQTGCDMETDIPDEQDWNPFVNEGVPPEFLKFRRRCGASDE